MQNTEKNPPALTAPHPQRKLDILVSFILLFLLIVSPTLSGSVDPLPVLIIETGALLIFFLCVVKSVSRGFFEFTPHIVYIPLALFLFYIIMQYIFIKSIVPDFTLGAVYPYKIRKEILKLFTYSALFIVVLNDFQKRRRINTVIYTLVCIGFCLSVFGITQKLAGQKSPSFFSSFPNRNHFASYINMVIFLVMGGVFSQFPLLRDYIEKFNKGSILKTLLVAFQKGIWLYLFGLIIMLTGLFFSLSRAGIISFFCGLVFFSFLIARKGLTRRGYLFLLLILISTLAVLVWVNAPEQIAGRFSKIEEVRPLYVDKAFDMIEKYKMFGVGFGAFEFIYNEKYAPLLFIDDGRTRIYIDHLHNDFVELLCEMGLAGFAIFIIAALIYVIFILRMLYKRHDAYAVGIGIGAMASLLSMCIHSLFDFNFHISSNAILFFVMAGLGIVISGSKIKDGQEISLVPRGRIPLSKNIYVKIILLAALSAGFFYAAWIIAKPYRAYAIAARENAGIADLKEAISLDPQNDKYHFLLAQRLIYKARKDVEYAPKYIELALKETRRAIELNPWDNYYPEYLKWISGVFTPSIKELI
jgi:O-antigen ligase